MFPDMAKSNVSNKLIPLEQINDEATRALLPTMIYSALIIILGVIWNSCVIFYYRFKTKYTPHSYFIMVLGVFDFCLCTICMPLEIQEIRFFYMANDTLLCKIHGFSSYVFSISSLFVLLSITVERYRGICQPFKPKMTRMKARLACISCFLLGVLLSSPMLFLHDIIHVNVTSLDEYVVEVRYCTTVKENAFQNLYWIINFGYLLGFACISSALITLYSLIGKQMLKQSKFRKQTREGFRQKTIDSPSYASNRRIGDLNKGISTEYEKDGKSTVSWRQNNSDSKHHSAEIHTTTKWRHAPYKTFTISVIELECPETRSHVWNSSRAYEETFNETSFIQNLDSHGKTDYEINKCRQVTRQTNLKYTNDDNRRSMEILNKTEFQASRTPGLQSKKLTLPLLLVTSAFILSYVPFVCLRIWRVTEAEFVLTNMSDTELVFYFIGLRSYLINIAINPIIFGACNNQFREFFYSSTM